jgi:formate hydrogenlyase subunit 3/multisubunit Na+/H+ antiporter MnhD subunit
MNELLYMIVMPGAMGIVPLFFPKRGRIVAGVVALLTSGWMLFKAIRLFGMGGSTWNATIFTIAGDLRFDFALRLYDFSAFVLLFIALFGVLIVLYSLGYFLRREISGVYYSYILWTLAAAAGAVLSDNLLLLLIFWEILTMLLYLLVNMGGEGSEAAAAKCFTVLGFSDAAMLLGVLLAWIVYGTMTISALSIPAGPSTGVVIFLLLFAGAIAKAGAMPLHSWLPAMAIPTPAPVMAFLPAALDKLLGIYLLARISLDIFTIQSGSGLSIMMMIIGSATILFAVLMALVQHDLKKLLSFHAVSQVGYMVLGVGSGIPVAIVGGLFHMLNNAIYKSGLFLSAGAVEDRAGTTDLEELGGLARLMPLTFLTTAVAALSISGVPPLNGFASKWLVYQGMLEGGGYHVIFLAIAVFGSALTLASFIKVLHSVFLGRRQVRFDGVREPGFAMQVPMLFLAVLCIVFGIWAQLPLERFINPAIAGPTGIDLDELNIVTAVGFWTPATATVLLIVGLVMGLLIYLFGRVRGVRIDENVWIGGNVMDNEEMRIPGTHFYKTVTDDLNPAYSALFRDGENGALDWYNIWGRLGNSLVQVLRSLHNGILSTYLSWAIIGLGILTFVLMFHL